MSELRTPLRVADELDPRNGYRIYDADGAFVCGMIGHGCGRNVGKKQARRIVAAVNATAAVEIEVLEAAGFAVETLAQTPMCEAEDYVAGMACENARLREALEPFALRPLGDDPRVLNGLKGAGLYEAAGCREARISGDDVIRARSALGNGGE